MIKQNQEIISITIDNKKYEKICSYINGSFISHPQTYLPSVYSRIKKEYHEYTEEMEEKANKIKLIRELKEKDKLIDKQRFILNNIMSSRNKIELIIFICKKLESIKLTENKYEKVEIINKT